MIRKAIIIVAMVAASGIAVAWQRSYAWDRPTLRLDSYVLFFSPQECVYATSWTGWLRFGTIWCASPPPEP